MAPVQGLEFMDREPGPGGEVGGWMEDKGRAARGTWEAC